MKTRLKIWMLLAGIGLGVCIVFECALAQEGEFPPEKTGGIYKHRPAGWDRGEKTGWGNVDIPPGLAKNDKIEKLKKLREEDPEKFREVIANYRVRLGERLSELKKTDPEKFEQVMQKRRRIHRERLKYLRKNNPERFREVVQKRREVLENKLEELKENNPQKYHQIMKRRKEHLKQLKHRDPVKYKKFLEKHPHMADRLEDIRDRREGLRDRREGIIRHRRDKGEKISPAFYRKGPKHPAVKKETYRHRHRIKHPEAFGSAVHGNKN